MNEVAGARSLLVAIASLLVALVPGTARAAAFNPHTLTVTPSDAPAGLTVLASGTGWDQNSTVTIALYDASVSQGPPIPSGMPTPTPIGPPLATPLTDQNGVFEQTSLPVPDVPPGEYTIIATYYGIEGETVYSSPAVRFTVDAPTVTVDPLDAMPGDTVAASGSGWGANTPVTIAFYQANKQVSTPIAVPANEDGMLTQDLIVPDVAPGDYQVIGTYTGADEEVHSSAPFTFTVDRSLPSTTPTTTTTPPVLTGSFSVTPTHARPGDVVTIAGAGWVPGVPITIYRNRADVGTDPPLWRFDVGPDGTFSGQEAIPDPAPTGEDLLYAVQETAPGPPNAAFLFTVDAGTTTLPPNGGGASGLILGGLILLVLVIVVITASWFRHRRRLTRRGSRHTAGPIPNVRATMEVGAPTTTVMERVDDDSRTRHTIRLVLLPERGVHSIEEMKRP